VCNVTCLQSGASFSGIVTTVGIGAVGVVDEVVVVVRETCDMAVYHKLCTISSSPSYQVTGQRTTLWRHAALSLEVTTDACK
jgi:hypothetical protein